MKVLVTAPYIQEEIEYFLGDHKIDLVIPRVNERLSEEELLQLNIAEFDGIICGDDELSDAVLSAAKNLKVISKWGTGTDSIDIEACERLGIKVCNTPNAFTDPVADTVLAYILYFARDIRRVNANMQAGCWMKTPCVALNECTLGVIGVGNIGKAVVKRAKAFNMRLLGHDVVEMPKNFLDETGITMVDKDTLLDYSDFISLNCTLNPSSRHILNWDEFAKMTCMPYIVNTARGMLINEIALIHALEYPLIAGAALDVFETEPLPHSSPLRHKHNVITAPHNANSSPTAWERVHKNTVSNLLKELK